MLDQLGQLVTLVVNTAPGAMLASVALSWAVYERRKVDKLQSRLYRLACAGLAAVPPTQPAPKDPPA